VLFDSARGVTWGDDSGLREREKRFAGGDGGGSTGFSEGGGGGGGREPGISHRAGSMSSLRTMFQTGSEVCLGSDDKGRGLDIEVIIKIMYECIESDAWF
jgi:hypothetical protein